MYSLLPSSMTFLALDQYLVTNHFENSGFVKTVRSFYKNMLRNFSNI
ncbi:hypothetical protein C2W64_03610 [Brevibacillus laterosporus]|nr:hypothetical protein C2W64_03610 [Brevibacillus laterosporus]